MRLDGTESSRLAWGFWFFPCLSLLSTYLIVISPWPSPVGRVFNWLCTSTFTQWSWLRIVFQAQASPLRSAIGGVCKVEWDYDGRRWDPLRAAAPAVWPDPQQMADCTHRNGGQGQLCTCILLHPIYQWLFRGSVLLDILDSVSIDIAPSAWNSSCTTSGMSLMVPSWLV